MKERLIESSKKQAKGRYEERLRKRRKAKINARIRQEVEEYANRLAKSDKDAPDRVVALELKNIIHRAEEWYGGEH